jgi:hypothetical protein
VDSVILWIIIVAALIGLVPALIARTKGGNFIKWWIYGAVIFPIALPHSLGLNFRNFGLSKSCGYCRIQVPLKAAHCPKCGYEFPDLTP